MGSAMACNRFSAIQQSVFFLPALMVTSVIACNGSEQVKTVVISGELYTRHQVQSAYKDGWKCEVWLNAASFDGTDTISISVRLMPLEANAKLRKVNLNLKAAHGDTGKIAREAIAVPEFKDCAKMPAGQEVSGQDGQFDGSPVDFPPKGPCWQATALDPFRASVRYAGTPLEPGNYLLALEVHVEGGPTFTFDRIRFSTYRRGKK